MVIIIWLWEMSKFLCKSLTSIITYVHKHHVQSYIIKIHKNLLRSGNVYYRIPLIWWVESYSIHIQHYITHLPFITMMSMNIYMIYYYYFICQHVICLKYMLLRSLVLLCVFLFFVSVRCKFQWTSSSLYNSIIVLKIHLYFAKVSSFYHVYWMWVFLTYFRP